MKNKGNAKSLYSKKLILNSLIELLEYRRLEMVTISEICDNAMISRKTFYRNFSTKIDILDVEACKFIEDYLIKLNKLKSLYFQNIINLIFEMTEKRILFIETLIDNNLTYLIFDRLLPKIIEIYKIRQITLLYEFGERSIENVLTFSFGGFENYIKKWVKDKNRVTVKQINNDFFEIIQIFYFSTQIDKKGSSGFGQ